MGNLEPVFLTGDSIEGLAVGQTYLGNYRVAVNRDGRFTHLGLIGGAGVTTDNDFALIGGDLNGDFSVIAREGQQVPNLPTGVVFDEFYDSDDDENFTALNAVGQTAFLVRVRGPGITTDNDRGIWAQSLDGQLQLIAREGDQIDVSNDPFVTELRTIQTLSFLADYSGNDDGNPSGFNDLGQLAFSAEFTDGSKGVFVSDLVATLSGDYNEDGNINGGDFLWWQRGESPLPKSMSDLQMWQAQYGATTSSSVSLSVPEGSSFLLACAAMISGFSRRRTANGFPWLQR